MVGKQEFGYLYNYEKGFRVLKANLMYDILDLQLKVSLSAEDEILIEFSEAYKGLIKRAFYHNQIINYKLLDEKANKKLIKDWQRKSRINGDDDTQTAVSKEDKNYLTQYLAALIIQEHNIIYDATKKKKALKSNNKDKEKDIASKIQIRRDNKNPSELVILEPRFSP